jgi:uncharacterized phage-associated protein
MIRKITHQKGAAAMSYSAVDVAKYIVTYSNRQNKPVSNLKLQKILYFTWIDYFKDKNSHLFEDHICAWGFGPVVPAVYRRFCIYAGEPISREYDVEIGQDDTVTLNGIIDQYLDYSASALVNMSHEEGSAWHQIYNDGEGRYAEIPFDLIKELERDS